jgi:hypothetical protein
MAVVDVLRSVQTQVHVMTLSDDVVLIVRQSSECARLRDGHRDDKRRRGPIDVTLT